MRIPSQEELRPRHRRLRSGDPDRSAPPVTADDRGRTGTNVYNNRGYVYFAKKDYARAIADYDRAIKVDPKDALIYHNRGLAYSDTRDFDRAIADFSEAIKLDPNYAVALNKRGIAYYAKRDYDRAIADFERGGPARPEICRGVLQPRQRVCREAGQDDRAIADYDAPSALDAAIRLRLRQSRRRLREQGRPRSRARRLLESLRLDPTNANDFNRRGVAYYGKKDYDRAIADYDQAIKLNPAYPTALINRGNAWRAKGSATVPPPTTARRCASIPTMRSPTSIVRSCTKPRSSTTAPSPTTIR